VDTYKHKGGENVADNMWCVDVDRRKKVSEIYVRESRPQKYTETGLQETNISMVDNLIGWLMIICIYGIL
jgi:hypothetical protein